MSKNLRPCLRHLIGAIVVLLGTTGQQPCCAMDFELGLLSWRNDNERLCTRGHYLAGHQKNCLDCVKADNKEKAAALAEIQKRIKKTQEKTEESEKRSS